MRMMMLAAAILATSSPALAQPKAAPPAGFRVQKDGTLVHRASGTKFPLLLAGFTRTGVKPFDAQGHDIAITYRKSIGPAPVEARIGLIHVIGMTPQEHYLGMSGIAGRYFDDLHPTGIALQGQGPFTPPGMKAGTGYQGRFRATLNRTPYELSLTTVSFGYWSARLTAAYPQAASTQAREEITALAGALRLTGPKPIPKRR